jgi:hypothetical protein
MSSELTRLLVCASQVKHRGLKGDTTSTTSMFNAAVQSMNMGEYWAYPDQWYMIDSGFDPHDKDDNAKRCFMLWSEFLGVINNSDDIYNFIMDGKTGKKKSDYYGVVTSMQFDSFVLQSQETDPFNFWATLGAVGELLHNKLWARRFKP